MGDKTLKQINNYYVSINGGTLIKIGTQKIYSWTETHRRSSNSASGGISISFTPPPGSWIDPATGDTVWIENYETNKKYNGTTTTEHIQYKKNLDGTIRCWRFGPNSQNWSDDESVNPWRTPGESFKDFG